MLLATREKLHHFTNSRSGLSAGRRIDFWVSFFNSCRSDIGNLQSLSLFASDYKSSAHFDILIWRILLADLLAYILDNHSSEITPNLNHKLARYDSITGCSHPEQVWGNAYNLERVPCEIIDCIQNNISRIVFQPDDCVSLAQAYDRIVGWEFTLSEPRLQGGKVTPSLFRKIHGVYYTPVDVAQYMCHTVLSYRKKAQSQIGKKCDSESLDSETTVLDPACGTGLFLRVYIAELEKQFTTVAKSNFQKVLSSIHGFDIDPIALELCRLSLAHILGHKTCDELIEAFAILRKNIRCEDSLSPDIADSLKFDFIVGNPPYSKITAIHRKQYKSIYKTIDAGNIYALFIERNLMRLANDGSMCFVVPLSIMFSRNLATTRALFMKYGYCIDCLNFDNIPGTIFSDGKPEHVAINRANSQRATILHIASYNTDLSVKSTQLLRWKTHERSQLFNNLQSADVTSLSSARDGIAKVGIHKQVGMLEKMQKYPTMKSLLTKTGNYELYLPKVARYFISALPTTTNPNNRIQLRFTTPQDRDLAAFCLNSSIFYWYWMVYGDGFHITQQIIGGFPIPTKVLRSDVAKAVRAMWKLIPQASFEKTNSGQVCGNVNFLKTSDMVAMIDTILINAYGINLMPSDLSKYRFPSLEDRRQHVRA